MTHRASTRLLIPRPRARTRLRARERGYAGLLALLIVSVATTTALFVNLQTDTVQIQNDRHTSEVLAASKAALLAYAVHGTGPTGRPGELPCPDTNGDGFAEATCETANSRVGLLPWKTLGIPEPRDAAGAPLWYALSANFRPVVGAVPADRRINSDTRGTLTIHGEQSATQLAQTAVAVVIAPGASLGSQNRGGSAAAGDYLDARDGVNNALAGATAFMSARANESFNDSLVYIATNEFIPLVEIRVAHEMKRLLTWYRSASNCKCYPWAASWARLDGNSTSGQNRGAFPIRAQPEAWAGTSHNDPERVPALPAWLEQNNWHNLIWYSVSRQASQSNGCITCEQGRNTLLVTDSGTDVRTAVVLFTPGTRGETLRVPAVDLVALLGLIRLPANLNAYLEDTENRDAADSACPVIPVSLLGINLGTLVGAADCDRYIVPRSARRDRDRIHLLGPAYPGTPGTCQSAGRILATEERCGAGWAVTNPTCIGAIVKLDSCNCQAAAKQRTQPPCNNNLSNNKKACGNAIAQLNKCS